MRTRMYKRRAKRREMKLEAAKEHAGSSQTTMAQMWPSLIELRPVAKNLKIWLIPLAVTFYGMHKISHMKDDDEEAVNSSPHIRELRTTCNYYDATYKKEHGHYNTK